MASGRLPGKPLAMIADIPMIVHVWRRAVEADVAPVIVATDHDDIASVARCHGATVLMTRSDHPSGSDRIAEALAAVEGGSKHDVVVNVQGDLPTISPETIKATVQLLEDGAVDVATAVALIDNERDRTSPDVVKMVGTRLSETRFRALYFTRTLAPWGAGDHYHHIGLYAWRRTAFEWFVAQPPSPLEVRERLEQLRLLEGNRRIDAVLVGETPLGVDTPDDLEAARRALA